MFLCHGQNCQIIRYTDKTVTFIGVCPKCNKTCGLATTYAVKDYNKFTSFSKSYTCPNESITSGNTFTSEVFWTRIDEITGTIDKSISTAYNKNAPIKNVKLIEQKDKEEIDYAQTKILLVFVDELTEFKQSSLETRLEKFGDIAEKKLYEYKDGTNKYVYALCIKEDKYSAATVDINIFENVYKIEVTKYTGEEFVTDGICTTFKMRVNIVMNPSFEEVIIQHGKIIKKEKQNDEVSYFELNVNVNNVEEFVKWLDNEKGILEYQYKQPYKQ